MPFACMVPTYVVKLETMEYRDPNTLFRTNEQVGKVDSLRLDGSALVIAGHVSLEAIGLFGLSQVVVLDGTNRFVQEAPIGEDGQWVLTAAPRDIGNDNAALKPEFCGVSKANNFVFDITIDPALAQEYANFVKSKLPSESKDVPSFRTELRELIISETRKPYISRSIREAISTGNNYQTLALDNTLRRGGRQSREKFLFQIDFVGKTVLDIGANTGENSRIARRLGASLVDGYEYDPYFVEIGRAVNAVTGMTRVSLFQGDCTRPELFRGMKYDIVLALAVWVYLKETIRQVADVTDVMVFETHTLDHGIEAYYQPVLRYFPHVVSLGYSDLPKDPHKSRMFMVFGKSPEAIESVLRRRFLKVRPYYKNRFIQQYAGLSKQQVKDLAKHCYETHVNKVEYSDREYLFGGPVYFELFLAGLHQFMVKEGTIDARVNADNLYLRYLNDSIRKRHLDPNLQALVDNPEWMVRKVSNKYEDALNILNGHVDRVAPIEIALDENGAKKFETSTGENLAVRDIDGHHRFFMCELTGVDHIHYVVSGDKGDTLFSQLYENNIATNYTLKIQ